MLFVCKCEIVYIQKQKGHSDVQGTIVYQIATENSVVISITEFI